jgi:hypothetical protein
MAELNVQPKSKTPAWIWIVVGLIVLVVLYFLLRGNDSTNSVTEPSNDSNLNVPSDRPGTSLQMDPLEIWKEYNENVFYPEVRVVAV